LTKRQGRKFKNKVRDGSVLPRGDWAGVTNGKLAGRLDTVKPGQRNRALQVIVFLFVLLSHKDKRTVNPLDVVHWPIGLVVLRDRFSAGNDAQASS
jgi:hypothetical protein